MRAGIANSAVGSFAFSALISGRAHVRRREDVDRSTENVIQCPQKKRILVGMLIRFKSEVGGFVMFGDVAVKLLRMTGHSGTVPGAIGADDVAASLARLEKQLAAQSAETHAVSDEQERGQVDGESEPVVSLAQRAFPMIELMRRAAAEPCAIQWLED